jgi:hypothetical protein
LKKALLLLPLILTIGIVPFVQSQTLEIEECRDGLIVVHLINGNTYTCKTPETAERWEELGIAIIVDPNYERPIVVTEEPKSILEKLGGQAKQKPIPIPAPFETAAVDNKSETGVENSPPKENPGKAPDHSNANPLPGTPRKVGQNGVVATGFVVIEVFDNNGNKKFHREDHNLVVDAGLQSLADLAFGTTHVSGESAGGFTYISVGTDGTSPVAGDTDCGAQLGSKKQDLSVTNTALGGIINVSWIAELPADTIQEICLTDNAAAATGNLFSRQTYTAIPIAGTDTVNAEWTITFADSNGT